VRRGGYLARMRMALGTALLVLGLALYALAAMRLAVWLRPDGILVQTLYYGAAGLLWVWPAARVTRWMQARR
jgi:ABC-type nickel/cobalt efflux system permease component RcnA